MNTLEAIRRSRPDVADPNPEVLDAARARLRAAMAPPTRTEAPDVRAATVVPPTRPRPEPPVDDTVIVSLVDAAPVPRRRQRPAARWSAVVAATAASIAVIAGGAMVASDGVRPPLIDAPLAGGLDGSPTPPPTRSGPPGRVPLGTFDVQTHLEMSWMGPTGRTVVTRPTMPGPWPVVFLLGDIDATGGERRGPDLDALQPTADLLASAGAQVVMIDWTAGIPDGAGDLTEASGNIACAVAAAQWGADAKDGDTARMTLVAQGAAALFAVDSVVNGTPIRESCATPYQARPDQVISLGGDLEGTVLDDEARSALLGPEGLAGRARVNTQVPLLFLEDTARVAELAPLAGALRDRGYRVTVELSPGPVQDALDPESTSRAVLDRIVDVAHAAGR